MVDQFGKLEKDLASVAMTTLNLFDFVLNCVLNW